jgi:hypothetical protein
VATPIEGSLRLTASLVGADDAPLSRAGEAVRSLMAPFIARYIQEHRPPGMELLES